jgi:hypothetical protein
MAGGGKEMHSRKKLLALSPILTIAAIALSNAVVFAERPPGNTSHPCVVTVGRVGDSILSDGKGPYIDGESAEARLWDMANGVADHLLFQVSQRRHGRSVKLTIPGLVNDLTCEVATFKPNQNSDDYQFYNELLVGESTDDPGIQENFAGTITCLDHRGRNGWTMNYQTQCIVIAHTGVGSWTVTADGGIDGCPAAVSSVTNGAVTAQGNHDVPFQLQATELP